MKRYWTPDELKEHWTLHWKERRWSESHKGAHNRLGFAVLLKYFQYQGRFPTRRGEVSPEVVAHVARQLEISPRSYRSYNWQGRSIKNHRAEIRRFLKYREATLQDTQALVDWLSETVIPHQRQMDALLDIVYGRCRALHIEPPTVDRIQRLIRSALARHDEALCLGCSSRLTPEVRKRLDDLVATTSEDETSTLPKRSALQELKLDPGRLSLETIQDEIDKLERLRACGLPADLFQGVSTKILDTYRQRASAEESYEIRRHPEALRYTLLAAFCWTRQQEIVDALVELLIDTVHHLQKRAEDRVNKTFLADLRRVSGKNEILVKLSEAALAQPDGIVRRVLYPVVGEETMRDIVKEHYAGGSPDECGGSQREPRPRQGGYRLRLWRPGAQKLRVGQRGNGSGGRR